MNNRFSTSEWQPLKNSVLNRAMLRSRAVAVRLVTIVVIMAGAAILGCSEENPETQNTSTVSSDRSASTASRALIPSPTQSALEPAPNTMQEKQVLRQVAMLDADFLAGVDELEAEIRQEPTNADNVADRVLQIQAYYDALQGHGVLLNYFTNSVINRTLTYLATGAPIPANFYGMKVLDRSFAELQQIQASIGKTGSLTRLSPQSNILEAKAYQTVVLAYQVGELGLDAGSRIRIGHNWYSDLGGLQFSRPLEQGYTTVTTNREGVEFVAGPEFWYGQQFTSLFGAFTPSITMTKGHLEAGSTITFRIGDKSQGSPGWLTQSFSADAMDLRFEADFEGDGLWVPIAQPRFQVTGSKPDHLRIIVPSVVRPGEQVQLRVNVEDRYFNEASSGPAELIATLNGIEVARAKSVTGKPGRFLFPAFDAPGGPQDAPYYLEVSSADNRFSGRSNPMMVRSADTPKIYWGEMHGHAAYTDANGTPDWYLSYAQNVAFLDFASLTEHDLMLSELQFRDIARATREHNDPQHGFITFPAYEWTAGWATGGHHNVFYLDASQRVLPTAETGTLSNMLAAQRKYNDPDKVLIIPHAHQPGDWTKLDDKLGNLVEIYSDHGSFEWFGRRYLQQGYQVGFNAASDDHIGHPGNSPARTWSRGGLAAVFALGHGREPIFRGLKSRSTYATTLARIFLETTIAGGKMGEVVPWTGDEPVELTGMVAGTAPIASIGVVVNGEDVHVENYTDVKQDSRALWFRVTSSSEPNNPATPRTPARGVRYWGFIEVEGARIAFSDVQPLGIEPYGDVTRQISGTRAAFSWRVRGDYDGLLLELAKNTNIETVKVQIWRSDLDTINNWNIQHQGYLPGEYERDSLAVPLGTQVVNATVALTELLGEGVSGAIEKSSQWQMSFVNPDLPTFRKFSFSLDKASKLKAGEQNNVYIRVKQLDDHTAWSSPVFLKPA